MGNRIAFLILSVLASTPVLAQTPPPKAVKLRAAAPPAPPRLPFQAPVVGPVTQDTRFTSGVVLSVEPSGKRFALNTASGSLTCDLDPTSRLIGPDGKPTTAPSLHVGGALRLYYTVGQGAHVQEADLAASASP